MACKQIHMNWGEFKILELVTQKLFRLSYVITNPWLKLNKSTTLRNWEKCISFIHLNIWSHFFISFSVSGMFDLQAVQSHLCLSSPSPPLPGRALTPLDREPREAGSGPSSVCQGFFCCEMNGIWASQIQILKSAQSICRAETHTHIHTRHASHIFYLFKLNEGIISDYGSCGRWHHAWNGQMS